jgi:hypothetical protein
MIDIYKEFKHRADNLIDFKDEYKLIAKDKIDILDAEISILEWAIRQIKELTEVK